MMTPGTGVVSWELDSDPLEEQHLLFVLRYLSSPSTPGFYSNLSFQHVLCKNTVCVYDECGYIKILHRTVIFPFLKRLTFCDQ